MHGDLMKILVLSTYWCETQACYILLQIVCIIVGFKVEHLFFLRLLAFFLFKCNMAPLQVHVGFKYEFFVNVKVFSIVNVVLSNQVDHFVIYNMFFYTIVDDDGNVVVSMLLQACCWI